MSAAVGRLSPEDERAARLSCACGHAVVWHHDERGCTYRGVGPLRCQCRLDSNDVAEALIGAALAAFKAEAVAAIEAERRATVEAWSAYTDYRLMRVTDGTVHRKNVAEAVARKRVNSLLAP